VGCQEAEVCNRSDWAQCALFSEDGKIRSIGIYDSGRNQEGEKLNVVYRLHHQLSIVICS